MLTASLHSAGPLLGLATYRDTSTQLPWPVGGRVSTFRFHQIIVINFTEGSLTKLFNAIKQLHQLLASPIAEKGEKVRFQKIDKTNPNSDTPAKQLETPIINQPVLVGGAMLTKLHPACQAIHTQVNSCWLDCQIKQAYIFWKDSS